VELEQDALTTQSRHNDRVETFMAVRTLIKPALHCNAWNRRSRNSAKPKS